MISQNFINSSDEDDAFSIRLSSDNGYIMTGSTAFGGTANYPNILAIKTDSNGIAPNIVNIINNSEYNKDFELFQNYPNPFNPSTTIKYNLNFPSNVNIKIYDINGKEIFNLLNEYQNSGYHFLRFDAKNLPSGIYFYKFEVKSLDAYYKKDFYEIRKMMLIK